MKVIIVIIIIIFFIYLLSEDVVTNIVENSSITVIADNKNELIIKEDNITKTVNKLCTHMGCLVKYNKDSGKLICPCHDSEFSLNGKVLRGPATKDLAVTINESFTNCNNSIYDW